MKKRISAILFSFLCVVAAGLSTVVVYAALTNVNMRLTNSVIFDAEGVYFKAHLKVYHLEDLTTMLYEDTIDLSGRATHNPYKTTFEIPENTLGFAKDRQTIVYQIEIENFTEDTMVRASITNLPVANTYITNNVVENNVEIDAWTVAMGDDGDNATLEMRTTINSFKHSFALDNSFTIQIDVVE